MKPKTCFLQSLKFYALPVFICNQSSLWSVDWRLKTWFHISVTETNPYFETERDLKIIVRELIKLSKYEINKTQSSVIRWVLQNYINVQHDFLISIKILECSKAQEHIKLAILIQTAEITKSLGLCSYGLTSACT